MSLRCCVVPSFQVVQAANVDCFRAVARVITNEIVATIKEKIATSPVIKITFNRADSRTCGQSRPCSQTNINITTHIDAISQGTNFATSSSKCLD